MLNLQSKILDMSSIFLVLSYITCQMEFSDVGLHNATPVKVPFPTDLKLVATSSSFLENPEYRRIIRMLLYLPITRPDIAYSVQKLSQFI